MTAAATAARSYRYIIKCKRCKKVASYTDTTAPDRYGHASTFRVCECGKNQLGKVVRGKYDAKVACNARCMHAASADCTCSCGGLNHAADYEG